MRKRTFYFIALLATLVVAALLIFAFAPTGGGNKIKYPRFDLSQSQPQVVVQMQRDFAYRTGDSIAFTVFIEQAKGTVVDENSFAITDTNAGDLEFTSSVLETKSLNDGEKLIAVQVILRKWSYKPSFTVAATMSYIVSETGDTAALTVPDIKVYMSPTWDGRKTLNEGDAQVLNDNEPVLNFVLIGIGLGVGIIAFVYIRRARRHNSLEGARQPHILTELELARERYELVRDLIKGRDFRKIQYEELERIVRALFSVETLSTDKVTGALGQTRSWAHADVTTILTGCDKRLYQGVKLSVIEHEEIFSAFEHLLDEIPQHEVVPPPRVTKPTPLHLPRFLTVAGKWTWRHRPFRYYV